MHRSIVVRICALLVALFVAPPLWAESAQQTLGLFEGNFESAGSADEEDAEVKEKIDDMVSRLNFIKRPFARGRLKEATKPCDGISFHTDKNNLTIQCGDREPAVAPITGEQGSYVNEEGNKFVLIHKVGDRQILQVFADQDGMRKNLYQLSPDGQTVTMQTSIESDQLPEPLVYERTYKRGG